MLWNDSLASWMPASPSGSEEVPGEWPLVMGRANIDLIFGSFMLRTERSHNSSGGNSVRSVMYLSLIKYLVNFLLSDVWFVGIREERPVGSLCSEVRGLPCFACKCV